MVPSPHGCILLTSSSAHSNLADLPEVVFHSDVMSPSEIVGWLGRNSISGFSLSEKFYMKKLRMVN